MAAKETTGQSTCEVLIRAAGKAGDWGWITMAHGEVYDAQFDWTEIELNTAQVLVDFNNKHDPEREKCWIAEVDGRRAGCIMCVASEEQASAARLRLLLVDARGRGAGVGSALVKQCVDFARQAEYQSLTLRTYHVLEGARKLYRRFGFERIGEQHTRIFGTQLMEETWSLQLR